MTAEKIAEFRTQINTLQMEVDNLCVQADRIREREHSKYIANWRLIQAEFDRDMNRLPALNNPAVRHDLEKNLKEKDFKMYMDYCRGLESAMYHTVTDKLRRQVQIGELNRRIRLLSLTPTPSPAPQTAAAGSVLLLPSKRIVLIACCATKLNHSAPARSLYTSCLFQKSRRYAEANRAEWHILSARYGLISPLTVIEPYDITLNSMSIAERRAWAAQVLDAIPQIAPPGSEITFLAGRHYREYLELPLQRKGYIVHVPLASLGIGQQLQWLKKVS